MVRAFHLTLASCLCVGLVPLGAAQSLVGPSCGASTTTLSFNGTTGPIPNSSSVEFTAVVSGLGAALWDVDLRTFITHTACQDLDVYLISPSGTTVAVTTDNAGLNDNCFNGTLWDEGANDPVTDRVFTNNVTATPLNPEGRFAAFRGENPNGTWRLRIFDDALNNVGSLASWSLEISALASLPGTATTTLTRSPGIAIPDASSTSDVITATGLGTFLRGVTLYVELPHTYSADLDVSLISPSGTSAIVTTDGGGSFDNVFNGTLFDPDVTAPVTDWLFANNVVATPVSPEGSFDLFVGENPNGNWTLLVADDTAGNTGSLVRWDLALTTSANPFAPGPVAFAGTSGAIPDFGPGPAVNFTAVASGLGNYLWDVDLFLAIAHGFCADLDITLTSPAGTTITITTDNGFTGGVFNGTLFDDNANDLVGDHFYTSNVVATPLTPEGRLSAFRGEDPNGTWTLGVADDSTPVAGTLNTFTLSLSTIAGAPAFSASTFSRTPNVPIPDLSSVVDTLSVSGMATAIGEVVLYTEILHTWSNDLDILLTSPAGTAVWVSTDNGGSMDDVFNGTTWDPSSAVNPCDYAYVDFVTATPLAPEGSFDNFLGQDPNGTWQLEVFDDFANDVGTLVRWDLTVSTCGGVGPPAYCPPNAPGTTSGCLPTISAASHPNVAHSIPCVVNVTNVEGQKSGIVFYGISGTMSVPWCTGGNSFLCVKPPTQRTLAQNSGGFTGQCNGTLTLDWNAFQLGNPGSLGAPWLAGDRAQVQGWFRDPASCKTTFLSAALELTYQP
jgi:subtilisin-like proprotein convertase family protein